MNNDVGEALQSLNYAQYCEQQGNDEGVIEYLEITQLRIDAVLAKKRIDMDKADQLMLRLTLDLLDKGH